MAAFSAGFTHTLMGEDSRRVLSLLASMQEAVADPVLSSKDSVLNAVRRE
jgi:hypothetical protein